MTILILWGTLFSKNRGVNALARATVDLIKEIKPNEKIILIGSGRKEATDVDGMSFIPMPGLKSLLWIYCVSYLGGKNAIRQIFGDMELNDVFVFDLSEGDSFTDIYGYPRFLAETISKMLFLKVSSSYILLPQTIGPFRNMFSRFVAKKIMTKFDLIIARDYESKKLAEKMIGKQCDFCYDMAFTLSPVQTKIDPKIMAGKIGINVSGLLWNGGYTGKNQFDLKADYRGLLVDICRYFLDNGYDLVIIPHTYGSNQEYISKEDDLMASKHLMSLIGECEGKISLISDNYTEQELKWIISNVDFFIGSRMHSCIAALSSGVPAIGIAYSMKFKGVFESVGANEFILDARGLGNKDILKQMCELFERRDDLKHTLLVQMPSIKNAIYAMMSDALK